MREHGARNDDLSDWPNLLLLPGLDGTARLFSRLIPHLPDGSRPIPVAYPADRVLDLDGLVTVARSHMPAEEPTVIVAESFSGPVGLRLASEPSSNLVGLVLVATFVTPPMSPALRGLVRMGAGLGARLPLPRLVARSLLLGPRADRGLVSELQSCVQSVSAAVVASRLRMLASVDARSELSGCPLPILYLGGAYDRIVPERCTALITGEPSVDSRILPAPHLVLQTQPEAAAREIAAFVGRVTATT